MSFAKISKICLGVLIVAHVVFTVFLFVEQGNIYEEVKDNSQDIKKIAEGFNQLVAQLGAQEGVLAERRNSIKATGASFSDNTLQISFVLGSDISSVTSVFQDWGDHSQEPKVADILFEVQGRALVVVFEPVLNPEDESAVVVVHAQSATLEQEIQVETRYDSVNRKLLQTGQYTQEPL